MSCASSSSRPAGLLFVALQGENQVNSYAVNLTSGNLSYIQASAQTGNMPSTMILDPTAATAFVLNLGSNDISAFTVASDGKFTAASGTTPITVNNSVGMARDAAGAFLFVVSQGSIPLPSALGQCGTLAEPNSVCPHLSVFAIKPGSTALTPVGNSYPLKQVPTAVVASKTVTVVDPEDSTKTVTGPLLYVSNNQNLAGNDDNTVSELVLDTATGTVKELAGSPYSTTSNPSSVLAVDVTPAAGSEALFVYVTNVTSNQLTIYQVCITPNAICTSLDVGIARMTTVGNPVNVGQNPVAMTTDPTNSFLYVLNKNSSSISSFRISQTGGTLSPLNPATLNTGNGPVAITMHPSGMFLYVSNSVSSNLSGFDVSTTTGSLSSPITVTSLSGPAGLASK